MVPYRCSQPTERHDIFLVEWAPLHLGDVAQPLGSEIHAAAFTDKCAQVTGRMPVGVECLFLGSNVVSPATAVPPDPDEWNVVVKLTAPGFVQLPAHPLHLLPVLASRVSNDALAEVVIRLLMRRGGGRP